MSRKARVAALALVLAAGFVALSILDPAVYRMVAPSVESRRSLESRDWYMLLRVIGTLWTWLAVALGILCLDALPRTARTHAPAWRRGAYVLASAAAAGLAAELLKLVVARERPSVLEGESLRYQGQVFRGLFSGFADGSNLGFPSSHAATAFGGAFALSILAPGLAPVALALALGCGLTRLLTGAHFATDVYAGIVVGCVTAWALARVFRPIQTGGKA